MKRTLYAIKTVHETWEIAELVAIANYTFRGDDFAALGITPDGNCWARAADSAFICGDGQEAVKVELP